MVLQFPMRSNIALPESIGYILTECRKKGTGKKDTEKMSTEKRAQEKWAQEKRAQVKN